MYFGINYTRNIHKSAHILAYIIRRLYICTTLSCPYLQVIGNSQQQCSDNVYAVYLLASFIVHLSYLNTRLYFIKSRKCKSQLSRKSLGTLFTLKSHNYISALSCVTLPVSVLSSCWEWSTINLDKLYHHLPPGYSVTSYQGGKLLIVHKEEGEFERKNWLNNPSVVANTVSGLWSSCLFLNGRRSHVVFVLEDNCLVQTRNIRISSQT